MSHKDGLHQEHVQDGAAENRQQIVVLPDVEDDHHGHRQQGEDELAQGEPEEQALLIVSDLFVDAYLDWISPPFPFLDFWQTGVAMSAGVC